MSVRNGGIPIRWKVGVPVNKRRDTAKSDFAAVRTRKIAQAMKFARHAFRKYAATFKALAK